MTRATADPLIPIGELARRADVPVRALRRWSDCGIVPPACRTDARYRMYGERERLRLEAVKAMHSLGCDIEEIGALATHHEPTTGPAAQLDAVRTRMADLEGSPWSSRRRLVARIKGWPEQSPQAPGVDWLAATLRVRCG